MLTIFILLCTWQTAALAQNRTSEFGSGSLNENGVCQCTCNLPESSFPVNQLETLQISTQNLAIAVEKEITKIQTYESTFTKYMEQLKNLTKRITVMEMGGVSYTELDFELLKMEAREMETLIIQLKKSMNGSNVIIETLHQEIHNISIIVNQLEVYDKNNVLLIRREVAALKKRLQECEKTPINPGVPPSPTLDDNGNCERGEIANVTKPFIVQLNWAGFSYKWGAWGRDSCPGTDQNAHWVALLKTDARMMNFIRFYPSYNNLMLYKNNAEKILEKLVNPNTGYYDYSINGQGSGMIAYNGSLYYNCYNTRDLCKLNTTTYAVERKPLPDAAFNNRFSYSSATWQDIDLAGDENGLWVIYATEKSAGNMVLSKINPGSLVIEQTWYTNQYKPGVTNAFMACGVLYATRALNTQREEIFYMYDTKSSKESQLSIPFDKLAENIQSMSYNPNDHKLYVFSDGYEITHDLLFTPLSDMKS
ncbi:olfactomedin-4-like [Hyperolius riggenbachi]|uniref:olfactomedin-4-like n=1 Tax=Hyperolius riggenbachi TaxID=752182 RepID=UPI0035A3063E